MTTQVSIWKAIADVAPKHPSETVLAWSTTTDDLVALLDARGLQIHSGILSLVLTKCGPDDLPWAVTEVGERLVFTPRSSIETTTV